MVRAYPHLMCRTPRTCPAPMRRQYDEYIANVEIKTEFVDDKSNHQRVTYKFTPYVFTGIDDIQIKGASLMPTKVGVPAWWCPCSRREFSVEGWRELVGSSRAPTSCPSSWVCMRACSATQWARECLRALA